MTNRTSSIAIPMRDSRGGVFIFRPLAFALGKVAAKIDPGVVGRLYARLSNEQRVQFWEAIGTSAPEAWVSARHDLRRPLVTASEASEQTIGDASNAGGAASGRWTGGHIEEVPKRTWDK